MARHCPDCGDPVSQGGVCSSCGYGRNGAKAGVPFDADWWRCANTERGQRCGKAGAISHGTYGGGPWFCQSHYFPERSKGEPPKGGFATIKAALRRILPAADPYEAAERAALQDEASL